MLQTGAGLSDNNEHLHLRKLQNYIVIKTLLQKYISVANECQ